MGTILRELLVGDCEHILPLNLLSQHILLISYYTNKKAMWQSGLLLDDNRDISEACVMRPLVEIAIYIGYFQYFDFMKKSFLGYKA